MRFIKDYFLDFFGYDSTKVLSLPIEFSNEISNFKFSNEFSNFKFSGEFLKFKCSNDFSNYYF